jgi:O-antigen ligase
MKNPTFLIVCVVVAVSPLMRGAVHPCAQTVIQILVALGGIVLAVTPVVDRAVTLTGGGIEENIAHRLNVWKGVRLMIADNPAAGTGPGTFEVAYPRYQQPGYPILVIYVHNDILQFSSDTGVLFFPLMLWLLFLFFRAGFVKFCRPDPELDTPNLI